MMVLVVVLFLVVACFAGVLVIGAPYLPTLKPQIGESLKIAELKEGQTLLELGCGDGRVLIAAAKQGVRAVGYELNPLLALLAWLRTRRYKGLVKVVWGDFWSAKWPPADVIFVFLLPRLMLKLDKKCIQYDHKPVKLISFAFEIPNRKADAKRSGLYLYIYPS